jgi:hypothetical protein
MTYTVKWTQLEAGACEMVFTTMDEAQDFLRCLHPDLPVELLMQSHALHTPPLPSYS